MTQPERRRLASWKEIAAYLHREVRTVIRWEKDRGLPVHRVPGGQGGSVFAFTDELDAWSSGQQDAARPSQPEPVRQRTPVWAIGAGLAALLAIAAAGLVLARPVPVVSKITIGESSLTAFGRDGAELWSFATPEISVTKRRQTQIADVNGDTEADALAALSLLEPDGSLRGRLFAIGSDGKQLWEKSIDTRLTFGAGDYDPPWLPDDILAFERDGKTLAALAVHHQTWWPSMLAVFDGRGAHLGSFVQSGWIRLARATADGKHLVTGGFSNSRGGAAFAVLDSLKPNGSSPEEPGSEYDCRKCPEGRPEHYFVVDWSDVTAALPPDERDVAVAVTQNGTIELRAIQRNSVDLIVELSPKFEVIRRSTSDAFWEWHARLERDGTLTHTREACAYRNGPVVREWTSALGWRTLK
jgi:hypothetical protein